MTFLDLRSSDTSNRVSTPKQSRIGGQNTLDDVDLHSPDSYVRTKPIPKQEKKVDKLKIQHEFEIKA